MGVIKSRRWMRNKEREKEERGGGRKNGGGEEERARRGFLTAEVSTFSTLRKFCLKLICTRAPRGTRPRDRTLVE